MFDFFKPITPTKCLLIGDSGTGKTTFIHRHLTGSYQKAHLPTIGVTISPIQFHTNCGSVKFNIWDLSGMEDFDRLHSGYFIFAQCAIIMFDLSSFESYKNVCKWRQDISNNCGNDIPIVVCGNKIDLELSERKVPIGSLRFQNHKNFQCFIISTRANFNIHLPFQWLCGKILNCDKPKLIGLPKMNPPEVQITQKKEFEIEKEMETVKKKQIMGKDECKCSYCHNDESKLYGRLQKWN